MWVWMKSLGFESFLCLLSCVGLDEATHELLIRMLWRGCYVPDSGIRGAGHENKF